MPIEDAMIKEVSTLPPTACIQVVKNAEYYLLWPNKLQEPLL